MQLYTNEKGKIFAREVFYANEQIRKIKLKTKFSLFFMGVGCFYLTQGAEFVLVSRVLAGLSAIAFYF